MSAADQIGPPSRASHGADPRRACAPGCCLWNAVVYQGRAEEARIHADPKARIAITQRAEAQDRERGEQQPGGRDEGDEDTTSGRLTRSRSANTRPGAGDQARIGAGRYAPPRWSFATVGREATGAGKWVVGTDRTGDDDATTSDAMKSCQPRGGRPGIDAGPIRAGARGRSMKGRRRREGRDGIDRDRKRRIARTRRSARRSQEDAIENSYFWLGCRSALASWSLPSPSPMTRPIRRRQANALATPKHGCGQGRLFEHVSLAVPEKSRSADAAWARALHRVVVIKVFGATGDPARTPPSRSGRIIGTSRASKTIRVRRPERARERQYHVGHARADARDAGRSEIAGEVPLKDTSSGRGRRHETQI